MANEKSVSLLMATLNEIEGMKHAIPNIDRSLFQEIIVVDGRSTDGTIEYARQQGLKVVIQPRVGLPDAWEHGYANCTGDIIITFTPDGNSKPDLLPQLCRKIKEGYDMVIVSRYAAGAQSYDDDCVTAFGNRFFTGLINFLFRTRFTDTLVAYRAYTREAIERMGLHRISSENWLRRRFILMNCWEVVSVTRVARLKLKAAEIPGDEPKRVGGARKLRPFQNGLGVVLQILNDFFFYRSPY